MKKVFCCTATRHYARIRDDNASIPMNHVSLCVWKHDVVVLSELQ